MQSLSHKQNKRLWKTLIAIDLMPIELRIHKYKALLIVINTHIIYDSAYRSLCAPLPYGPPLEQTNQPTNQPMHACIRSMYIEEEEVYGAQTPADT